MDRDPTPAEYAARTILHAHLDETADLPAGLDLVTWGESSIDGDPASDPELDSLLGAAARRLGAPLLVNGAIDVAGQPGRLHNTTFLYREDGSGRPVYAKRHLVPFGEYVPFRSLLTWVKELARVPHDFVPGSDSGIVDAGRLRLGDLICFESVDLGLARGEIDGGATLLVVTTNNRSFSTSPLSSQHVEIDRVLAESTGRSVIHAAVSGTSAVVLPDGRVSARAPLFERRSIVATVPVRSGRTPYVVWGDWTALAAALALVALVLGPAWRRRRAG
jgi:apolipoprotein N-acyltransferase